MDASIPYALLDGGQHELVGAYIEQVAILGGEHARVFHGIELGVGLREERRIHAADPVLKHRLNLLAAGHPLRIANLAQPLHAGRRHAIHRCEKDLLFA